MVCEVSEGRSGALLSIILLYSIVQFPSFSAVPDTNPQSDNKQKFVPVDERSKCSYSASSSKKFYKVTPGDGIFFWGVRSIVLAHNMQNKLGSSTYEPYAIQHICVVYHSYITNIECYSNYNICYN